MRSMLKSKKGISPILATLLLIVIAVAAVIVTYAWVMTFTESTTAQGSVLLSLDNIQFYGSSPGANDTIGITIRNSGTADATVDAVYFGNTSSNLEPQTLTEEQPVPAGSTVTITITDCDWESGTRYYFNIGTKEGVSLPFNKEA